MQRRGSAVWKGALQKGQGRLSTQSGALQSVPYSFTTRFAAEQGTNPEELIAAAHAGCFSMALSGALAKEGFEPVCIEATAAVTLEKAGEGWKIAASHINVEAQVPGITDTKFKEIAENAKANCPVSKLMNAELSLDTHLIVEQKPKQKKEEAPSTTVRH